ncbi:MAG TPA: Ig-like domain-containing protein, partial [Longimicrobium sp.]|nr:Ig-like domain-containing protein [Longimicrobium sp.]
MYTCRPAIRTLALLAAALAAAGCSDGGPTPPEEQVPAFIAVVAGTGQVAEVGTQLPLPLVVQVRTIEGEPVPGVTVDWSTLQGGVPNPASSTTDADGRASTRLTLATTAGEDSVVATVRGTQTSGRVGVRGMPGPAVQLRTVPDSVVTYWFSGWSNVQAAASDRYGNPLPELNIAWTSLEPQYASVESLGGGNARIDPAYPGRARVVAQAGPLADTV